MKNPKRDVEHEFGKTVVWILVTASFLVLTILALSLLKRNGTLDKIKESFRQWQEEQKAKKEEPGEKTVTIIGPSGISEYESWFLFGEAVLPAGTEPSDEERRKLSESPVKGNEEWWSTATKLTSEVTLYAQADTPLYGNPDLTGEVFGTAVAGEQLTLVAVIRENRYVVTDGIWFYCSEGERFMLCPPQEVDQSELARQLPTATVNHECKKILQMPELPHGCEITALAILLDYYGVTVDKCELSDHWLKKGSWGETDFRNAFIGNPRTTYRSAGCFAEVIEDTANRYLDSLSSPLTAKSVRGISFESLLKSVAEHPVLVYTTMELSPPYIAQVFTVFGEELLWQNREHCIVLTGYDLSRSVVFGMDPLYGACEYSLPLFALRFQTMFSQMVEIIETD